MNKKALGYISVVVVVALLAVGVVYASSVLVEPYQVLVSGQHATSTIKAPDMSTPIAPIVTHIATPESVKAIYMTACIASGKNSRAKLLDLMDKTEINAVVIDIKDFRGNIFFEPANPELKAAAGGDCFVKDMQAFIAELHAHNIYTIARLSTFQDLYYVKHHPEFAVHTKSGAVWKDRKGLTFVDAASQPFWDYIISIAKDAHAIGFDEINFDYIRFPSDGDMKNISFPKSGTREKSEVINSFFTYLGQKMTAAKITTSADLFGMTTSNTDDLGIGQILEHALENFDYVAPMVYPSHYPKGFMGFKNPNSHPFEVIEYAMGKAVARAVAASTTPEKLRPWFQDFSLGGVTYTPELVRAQIKANEKVGLDSWMLWSASNRYTAGALLPEKRATSTSY